MNSDTSSIVWLENGGETPTGGTGGNNNTQAGAIVSRAPTSSGGAGGDNTQTAQGVQRAAARSRKRPADTPINPTEDEVQIVHDTTETNLIAVPNFLADKLKCRYDALAQTMRADPGKVKELLKGRVVTVHYLAVYKSFPVADVTSESVQQIRIHNNISIADYFKQKGSALNFPEWPCIVEKSSISGGEAFYPLELLNMRLKENEVDEMGKKT